VEGHRVDQVVALGCLIASTEKPAARDAAGTLKDR